MWCALNLDSGCKYINFNSDWPKKWRIFVCSLTKAILDEPWLFYLFVLSHICSLPALAGSHNSKDKWFSACAGEKWGSDREANKSGFMTNSPLLGRHKGLKDRLERYICISITNFHEFKIELYIENMVLNEVTLIFLLLLSVDAIFLAVAAVCGKNS